MKERLDLLIIKEKRGQILSTTLASPVWMKRVLTKLKTGNNSNHPVARKLQGVSGGPGIKELEEGGGKRGGENILKSRDAFLAECRANPNQKRITEAVTSKIIQTSSQRPDDGGEVKILNSHDSLRGEPCSNGKSGKDDRNREN